MNIHAMTFDGGRKMIYQLHMTTDDGCKTKKFRAKSKAGANLRAIVEANRWVESRHRGPQGESVRVNWLLSDADGYIDSGLMDVHVEPKHCMLIREAYRRSSRRRSCCGWKVHDHDWTSSVSMDGGEPPHPGVEATGESVTIRTHCKDCGLMLTSVFPCPNSADERLGRAIFYEFPDEFCRTCDAPHAEHSEPRPAPDG